MRRSELKQMVLSEDQPRVAASKFSSRTETSKQDSFFSSFRHLPIAARGAEEEGRNPAQGSRGFGAP